jgi:hypothetical protein
MQAFEGIGKILPYYHLVLIIAFPRASWVIRASIAPPWARRRRATELYLCLVFIEPEDPKILGLEPVPPIL